IGASEGAKASLIAAPQIRPAVAGVVSLSAERTERGVDVLPWAARLRSPVLFFTAKDDSFSAEPTPQLYRAATKAASRQLVTLPGSAHGTDLLASPTGPKVQTMILDFLRRYGHAG
ncbi:MAG TPA: alpha/beta hydrolase, partial [Actinomycetota bacterium]